MCQSGIKFGRLKKRSDFIALAQSGNKWVTPALVIQMHKRPEDENQIKQNRIGYTASRKVGGAVLRNRAKRRMRALMASLPQDIAMHIPERTDLVLIARHKILTRDFAQLQKDLLFSLRGLKVIPHEN